MKLFLYICLFQPVSDEDSPFDDLVDSPEKKNETEKEDGEEKDSDADAKKAVKEESALSTEKTDGDGNECQEKEEGEASDEGEIKSSSSEAEPEMTEEEKERRAKSKPINMVDFGEAAKRVRQARGYNAFEPMDRRYQKPDQYMGPHSRQGYTSWQE